MSSEVPDNGVSAHGGAAACAAANDGDLITNSTSEALVGFGGNRRSNSADQVDEWMETVLELVQGQLRLLGDEVRGGIAVHLSQLGHLLSSHGNDEKLDRLCTQIAERIVRASGAAGAGATATAEAGLSELLGGAKAVCAAARSVQDGVARVLLKASSACRHRDRRLFWTR